MVALDKQNAINLQLLGGVWILQTLVAVVAGLYTRWLHRWALLLGWVAGMAYGTIEAYLQKSPTTSHFGASTAEIPFTATKVYIGVTALVINVVVTVLLTLALRALRAPAGTDHTEPGDYYSDATPSPQPV